MVVQHLAEVLLPAAYMKPCLQWVAHAHAVRMLTSRYFEVCGGLAPVPDV